MWYWRYRLQVIPVSTQMYDYIQINLRSMTLLIFRFYFLNRKVRRRAGQFADNGRLGKSKLSVVMFLKAAVAMGFQLIHAYKI